MSFANQILLFIISFGSFLLIDLFWLGVVAKGFYNSYLDHLMAETVNWTAAIIFYFLFVIGVFVFVIKPSVNQADVLTVIWKGALFGLITYATYDLTNLATLKEWPLAVTIVDMIWGTILSLSVSLIGFYVGSALF